MWSIKNCFVFGRHSMAKLPRNLLFSWKTNQRRRKWESEWTNVGSHSSVFLFLKMKTLINHFSCLESSSAQQVHRKKLVASFDYIHELWWRPQRIPAQSREPWLNKYLWHSRGKKLPENEIWGVYRDEIVIEHLVFSTATNINNYTKFTSSTWGSNLFLCRNSDNTDKLFR